MDDEPLARARIRNLLRDRPGYALAGEAANGSEALAAIIERRPDLVFLDVQMPDLDGFGVLERLARCGHTAPLVVFVTAYDRYALRAFQVHALDYLLKPFDDERFDEMLAWVGEHLERERMQEFGRRLVALVEDYHEQPRNLAHSVLSSTSSPPSASAPAPLSRLAIKSGGRVKMIEADEIDWISADGYYARLHVRGESFLVRETLQHLETALDRRHFRRIHRSTIVNLSRIRELQPQSHGEYAVILRDGTRLKLSRSYRDNLPRR